MAQDLSTKLAAKDNQGRGLSKNDLTDIRQKRLDALYNVSNVGTRIFGGRMGVFDNTNTFTFQITAALAQDFDAIRVVFANTSGNFSPVIYACAVSANPSLADVNNSAGTWVNVTKSGSFNFPLPIVTGSARIKHTVTDWMTIPSIPRTDVVGGLPLINIRAYVSATSALSVYGDGSDVFSNWDTEPNGRVWIARRQSGGNYAGSPAGFNSTTNVNQSPIVGVQYLSRGKVVNVAACGDSITDGRGTYLGAGFGVPLCAELSDRSSVAVEYSNIGWSGQTSYQFTKRGIDILDSPLCPDILILPTGSPNDIATTIDSSLIALQGKHMQNILSRCKQKGVKTVLWTWLPTDNSVKSYGSTDQLRIDANNAKLALNNKDFIVVDTSTAMSGAVVGGQVQMLAGSTTDHIHPNDTGIAIMKNIIKPAVQKLIGI